MGHKLFFRCHDGDEISVMFDYPQEGTAFEQVLRAITGHLRNNSNWSWNENYGGCMESNGLKLITTLQRDMAAKKSQDLRKITGLFVANFPSVDNITLVRHCKDHEMHVKEA